MRRASAAIELTLRRRLSNGNADYETIKAACVKVPTVVTIYLDRPAILTNVKDKVAALIGNFGVSDAALFDALTGKASPQGKLPFEKKDQAMSILRSLRDEKITVFTKL